DGSKLYIDGKQVVDNDGTHPPVRQSGTVKLTKGIHKVHVTFFQAGGGAELDVFIHGPGLSEREFAALVAPTEADLLKKPAVKPQDEDSFEVESALVAEGRKLFGSLGCASCHQLKVAGKRIPSTHTAPAFANLQADRGCLAEKPTASSAHYGL